MSEMALSEFQRRELYRAIAPKLDAIAKLFKNPKVTLVIRAPDLADGDFIMSEDDLDAVADAVSRLSKATSASSTVRE
jgi:hypothetical protein